MNDFSSKLGGKRGSGPLNPLPHFDSHAQGGTMGKKYYGGIGS